MTLFSQEITVVDSLTQIIATTSNDSVIMDTYNKLRRATYYGDPEASHDYTEKFLEYAEKRDDSAHMALAHYYLGNSNVTATTYKEALSHYLFSMEYYERKKDLARLPSVINAIGNVYEKQLNDTLALKYYRQSLSLSREIKDLRRVSIALVNISNILQNQNNFQEAIVHLEESITIVDQLKKEDPSMIPKLAQQEHIAKINLAAVYLKENKMDKSKSIYNDLIDRVDSIAETYIYGHALNGLGKVSFEQGNIKEAVLYLEASYRTFSQNNFTQDQLSMMPELIDAYKANKNDAKALSLFYAYNTLKDSLFSTEKDKHLTEALQKYESEKKERQIAEQQLTIAQKNRQKNQILFGLIVLAGFAVLLWIFFRKRLKYQKTIAKQRDILQHQKITDLQQKNKLTAMNSMIEGQEAERLRIAKDLHDSLGGLLSTVKAHFGSIQKECKDLNKVPLTEKTNELIDEACIEVRRISHNMMPHALSLSGLEGAVQDIAERLNDQEYTATFEVNNLPKMEPTREIMVYRLVQEIVSNIRKHANAQNVFIQLFGHQKEINLIVEDDGAGFDYQKAVSNGGLGLKSINSRVAFLDGKIEWDTHPGRGTNININMPVL